MSELDMWLENELSQELLNWKQRHIRRGAILFLLIMIVVFVGIGILMSFSMKKYTPLLAGAILGPALGWIGALILRSMHRRDFNFLPKKIKWSQEGIHYISRADKEVFIPWHSVVLIRPWPSNPLTGERFEDYFITWNRRFDSYSTSLSKEIGIKLEEAWSKQSR